MDLSNLPTIYINYVVLITKMVTVSHIVKKIIREKPYIEEAMRRSIISYGNLAEEIIGKIEAELNREVKHSAVVMALRRYAESLNERFEALRDFDYSSEIVLKTNICDFNVIKSNTLLSKLKSVYEMVDFDKGDTLSIILGNYEVSIILTEKYIERLEKFLKGEKILNKETGLVALSIGFKGDFFHTPGVIFTVVRRLAWDDINIYEIISTMTELTLILHKKDSMRAYESLQDVIGVKKKRDNKNGR